MEKLYRNDTERLKTAAVDAFVKKPKVARPYLRKIGRILKVAAPTLLLTTLLSMSSLGKTERYSPVQATIENSADTCGRTTQAMLKNLRELSSVVENVGTYLKQNPDVRLDISHLTFNAEDLALMKGKGSEKSKAVEKIAKTVSSENGYCARAVKKIVHKAGLLKDCSAEDRTAFLNVGAAWQLKPFFDKGCVKGFAEINLTEDAARARKTFLMFRVNEQWEGVERDANGKVVPNHAHVQAEGVGGYYFGQRNRNSCPYGHRDKTGILHEYGTASYYALNEDVCGLVQCTAEKKNLIAVKDNETNTLVCFSADAVPQQYQTLLAQHQEANKTVMPENCDADALRVDLPSINNKLAMVANPKKLNDQDRRETFAADFSAQEIPVKNMPKQRRLDVGLALDMRKTRRT